MVTVGRVVIWGELHLFIIKVELEGIGFLNQLPPTTVCDRYYPPPVYLISISPSSRIDTEFTAVYGSTHEHGQGTLIPSLWRYFSSVRGKELVDS